MAKIPFADNTGSSSSVGSSALPIPTVVSQPRSILVSALLRVHALCRRSTYRGCLTRATAAVVLFEGRPISLAYIIGGYDIKWESGRKI